MNIVKAHNLACPIDGEQLEYHGRQLLCENGHAFDIARQGYVNLLPVQHKRTKHPGDSKAMVLARTHFLNSGVYKPIANQLNKLVYTQITAGKETTLLDAGCGEGYYFNAVLNYLSDKEAATDLSFIGLDISKQRLKLLYGEQAQFKISEREGNVHADLIIPKESNKIEYESTDS